MLDEQWLSSCQGLSVITRNNINIKLRIKKPLTYTKFADISLLNVDFEKKINDSLDQHYLYIRIMFDEGLFLIQGNTKLKVG